jgi:hypothetical protein
LTARRSPALFLLPFFLPTPTPILPTWARSAFCFQEFPMTPTTDQTATTLVPRFSLGQIVATPAALDVLAEHGVSPQTILRRHLSGDWGTLCSDDVAANEAALTHGSRLLSSYEIAPGVTVWIITDAESDIDEAGNALTTPQRLCTTILRPEDY